MPLAAIVLSIARDIVAREVPCLTIRVIDFEARQSTGICVRLQIWVIVLSALPVARWGRM